MTTEAQKRASARYMKSQKQYILRCDKKNDADIIAYLNDCPNVTARIKELIRADAIKRYVRTTNIPQENSKKSKLADFLRNECYE